MDRRTVLKAGALAALVAPFAGVFNAPARAADPAQVGAWSAPFPMGGIAIHMMFTHVDDVLFFQYVEGAVGVDHTSYVATWNYRTGNAMEAPFTYDRDVFCAGHTILADGRVFIAGGHALGTGKKEDAVGVPNTDIYDPVTRTWTPGPLLTQARWYPTCVGTPNGKVLIIGGVAKSGAPSNTVEEYDPVTNTMRTLPSTATKANGSYPRMHVIPDGRVLRTGPQKATIAFSQATNSWAAVSQLLYGPRTRGSSILLAGATRALTVGGASGSTPTATAEILDLSAAKPAWRYTGSLTYARQLANTVVLPDGKVLIVGGGAAFKYTGPVKTPELFDPATETWTPMAPQQASRMYHSTTVLLPDARVLSAGQDNGTLASYGEIFSPPYLFKGPRPTITDAPASVGYGQPFTITTPDAASISTVTVIKAGSVTHQIDTEQRSIPLAFSAGAGSLVAQSPANANLAPAGYYMLFIVDSNGVPSVAPWIHIG